MTNDKLRMMCVGRATPTDEFYEAVIELLRENEEIRRVNEGMQHSLLEAERAMLLQLYMKDHEPGRG